MLLIDSESTNKNIKFKPMVMVDEIVSSIKKDIVYGKIKHGSSLSTRKISEDLNISRTPVREAIRKLEAEGLIELLPRRGFIVKEYGIDEIKEIYHVRKLLESKAIALACKNINCQQLECIMSISRSLNKELKKEPNDIFRIQELNKFFHFSIYCISHNKTLCSIIDNLWYKSFGLLITIFSAPNRREEIPLEHQIIIDSLKTRTKKIAIKALLDHIRETESILIAYSKKQI